MSRFTAPGRCIDSAMDETGDDVLGLVVATSRHKRAMDLGDAVAVLAVESIHYVFPAFTNREDYEAAVEIAAAHICEVPPIRWHSVTQAEIDQETHDPCFADWEHDPGDWCSEGQGAAWMDVLYSYPQRIADVIAELSPALAAGEQAPRESGART